MDLAVTTLASLHTDDWRLTHLALKLRYDLTRPLAPAHRETWERILAQVTHRETTVRWQIIVMSWRRIMVDAYLKQGDVQGTTDALDKFFTPTSDSPGNGKDAAVRPTHLPHLDLFRRAYLAIQTELAQLNGRDEAQSRMASLELAGSEKAALKKMTERWDRKMRKWLDVVDGMDQLARPVADKAPSPAPVALKRPRPPSPAPARPAPAIRENHKQSPEIARRPSPAHQLGHPDKAPSAFSQMLSTYTNDEATQVNTQPTPSSLPSIIQQRIAQGAAANAAKLKIQMEMKRVEAARIAQEEEAIEQEKKRVASVKKLKAEETKRKVAAQLWNDAEEEPLVEEVKVVTAATAEPVEAVVPVASTSSIPIAAPVVPNLRSPVAGVKSSPVATPSSTYFPTPAQKQSTWARLYSSAFQSINVSSTASSSFQALDPPPPFQQPIAEPTPTAGTIIPSSSPDVIPATAVDTSHESTAANLTTTTISSTEAPSAPSDQPRLLPSLFGSTMEEDSMRELPSQPLHVADESSLEDPSTEERSVEEELIGTRVVVTANMAMSSVMEQDTDVEMGEGGVSQKSFRELMGEVIDGLDDEEALAKISELVAHDSEHL